jgi:hypothetical protein
MQLYSINSHPTQLSHNLTTSQLVTKPRIQRSTIASMGRENHWPPQTTSTPTVTDDKSHRNLNCNVLCTQLIICENTAVTCNNHGLFFISNFRRVVLAIILHTHLPMKMEQSVPKRRHTKFRRRGITQKKKTYNHGLPFVIVWNDSRFQHTRRLILFYPIIKKLVNQLT